LGDDKIDDGRGNDILIGREQDDCYRVEMWDDKLFGDLDNDIMGGGLAADILIV
jgi:hypothetical protein